MNKHFKIISALLGFILCLSLLSSCGGKKPGTDSSSESITSENDGFDLNLGSDEQNNTGSGSQNGGTSSTGTANTSGKVTDLKGRVIKINVLSATNANTKEGKASLSWRDKVAKKYNCSFEEVAMLSESAGNSTITTSVLSGKPIVDLWFQNGASELFPHYQAKLLQNLSELNVFDFTSDKSPYKSNQEIFRFGNAYYGVVNLQTPVADPWYSNVVFFNDKLLKKYGVSEDLYALQKNNQWTWDKFKELADKFNRNCNDPSITACFDDGGLLYNALLNTRGIDWVARDKSSGLLSFNGGSKSAQEALTVYADFVKNGTVKLGPDSSKYGTSPFSGAGIVDGAEGKYSFVKGQSAFAIFPMLGMEWQISKNEKTTEEVKKNFGILSLPKVNSSDKITVASSVLGQGGYAIPYGVKKPNEIATVLNELQQMPYDKTELGNTLFNIYVVSWLNNATGAGTEETAKKIIGMTFNGECFATFSGLAERTTPNLLTDGDGWSAHVYKIANGNEAMGSVLPSVTTKYNKLLGDLYTQR